MLSSGEVDWNDYLDCIDENERMKELLDGGNCYEGKVGRSYRNIMLSHIFSGSSFQPINQIFEKDLFWQWSGMMRKVCVDTQ
ncbi:MAG: hypothetical protein NPIRA04_27090 [Nitrospirales bacterium]|nr:MAG: hypothetical protein NPIRA04_27090 [Nitrospirales bacterium]